MSKILEDAILSLNKIYGLGTIIRYNDKSTLPIVEKISSGSLLLDIALGGGCPKGRVIEIFGPESSGKTTLTLHLITESQKEGKDCAFIDTEHALDLIYAQSIGVDVDKLLFSQPDSGEQALEILEKLIKTNELGVIVIDSVAALTPQAELDGEAGDLKVGLQARLLSQLFRKIIGAVGRSNCLVVFTNQLRDKIGTIWGDPSVTTGGNALKFYATQRLDIRRIEKLKDKQGNYYGNRVKVNVVKNKVAPPFKLAEFEITFGKGINKLVELLELATDFGIIKINGSISSYQDTKLGTNREDIIPLLEDNPELVAEIEHKVLAKLGVIEITQEEQDKLDKEEQDRAWQLLTTRFQLIFEKYKLENGNLWLEKNKDLFNLELNEKYKKTSDYEISRMIKAWKE